MMSSKPTYEELEKRIAELERQVEQYETGKSGLKYSPEMLSALMEAFRYIPLCETFDDAAEEIFALCKQLTGARSGYVSLLSENGEENEVLFLDAGGMPCDVDPNLPMPIRGFREIAYKTNDVVYDNAFSESPWMKYMPEGHVRLDNVLFAPLSIEEKTVGIIGIANKPGGFNEKDVYLSKILGDLAAVALTYAKSQDSLRDSETKYRHLVSNLPGTAYQFLLAPNGNFRFEYIGENCIGLFGVSATDVMADANIVFDLIPQPDAGIVHEAIMNSAAALTPYNVEHRVHKKNGETVWISASSIPRKLDDGSIIWDGIGLDITEFKQTVEALTDSERKWRNILTKTPQVGISLNPKGEIVFANEHFLSLTGWSVNEVIGQNWFDMFIPEPIREEIRGVFRTVLRKKDASEFTGYENEILTRNGELRTIAWSNVLTKDARGEILDVTCLGIDVSERQRHENELKESDLKYRQLTETMFETLSVIDLNGVFLYANRNAARNLSDGKLDDITGKNIRQFLPENQAEQLIGKYQEVYSSNEPSSQEVLVHLQKGDTWFSNTLKPIDFGPSKVPAVLSVSLDITERKRSEKELKDAHKRFLTVLDGIDATVYVADMETHEILFMNKTMKNAYGRDLTGEACYAAFRNEKTPCPHCTNDRLLDANGNAVGAAVWQDKNPVTGRWYINHDRAIDWMDGRMVRLQVATDITEMKNMEKRLLQAQKMESIGNLAGGIAHDFNNILFPIVGLSEMLMEDFAPGSVEYENTKEIFKAGRRGSDLVKQILAFSRQSDQKMIPVRIQHVLKEVIKLSRSTIPANINITQDIQHDCSMVLADPTQIHQIAMNLITNAYHAVETSSGEISIHLKEVILGVDELPPGALEPCRYAVLSVSDTGVGIAPPILEKIFEPYFTTKEQGKGTGLGLAVVYGIVKEHHGDIKVRSEFGKGSTFSVYLPMMAKDEASESVGREEDVSLGHERILLIDDEEAISKLEKQMLERLGYKVTMRVNSLEALEAFKANPDGFDLVISDMSMPNMTGEQLAHQLIDIRPNIPIIICTGFSERLDPVKAASIGVKGFLMKPIVKAEMAKTIRKVLDEAKVGTQKKS
ncbi:MAG: PAS domain S-box protein [Pseudomonadota bacterium]